MDKLMWRLSLGVCLCIVLSHGVGMAMPVTVSMEDSHPIGKSFSIENTNGDVRYPTVAYDSLHDFYLVGWRGATGAIYGRSITHPGYTSGYLYLGTQTDDDRNYPDLAYNSTNDYFLAVWEQYYSAYLYNSIFAKKYHPDQSLGDEFNLMTATPDLKDLYKPAVAYSSVSNKFLVVWESSIRGSGISSIEGSFIPGEGVMSSNFILAQGNASWNYYTPDIAYLSSNDQFLVVWVQEDRSTQHKFISARRINANGTILDGASILICAQSNDQTAPAVGALPHIPGIGSYEVAWEYHYSPSDHDIYGAAVSWSGGVNPAIAIQTNTDYQSDPAVAGRQDTESSLVTWASEYPGMVNTGIYGRLVADSGATIGEQSFIGGLFGGYPAISSGNGGEFLIVYEDYAFFGDLDIWGRYWGYDVFLPTTLK